MLYPVAIRYTCDRELSPWWNSSILPNWIEGWDSARSCQTAQVAAYTAERVQQAERYGLARVALPSAKGRFGRSLVCGREWKLAANLAFEGTDAILVDYQDYH